MTMISSMQTRLLWAELVFLALDLGVFLSAALFLLLNYGHERFLPIDFAVLCFLLAIGMAISTYWITYCMRLQLKLKLRFFEARYIERKMDAIGENFLTDEEVFNKDHRRIESPDGMESMTYPHSLDGFMGGAQPRQLTWYISGVFFVTYVILFIWISIEYVKQIFA
jgi:hypothetical protein